MSEELVFEQKHDIADLIGREAVFKFLQHYGIMDHKISTYNVMVEDVISLYSKVKDIEVIANNGPNSKFSLSNVIAVRQKQYIGCTDEINKHRLENTHYLLDFRCKLNITYDNTPKTVSYDIKLLSIPLLVHSKYCMLYGMSKQQIAESGECSVDPGGYYLINGKERCIIGQERLNYNQVFIWTSKKSTLTAEVKSVINVADKPYTFRILQKTANENTFTCTIADYKDPFNVFDIIYILGLDDDMWCSTSEFLEKFPKLCKVTDMVFSISNDPLKTVKDIINSTVVKSIKDSESNPERVAAKAEGNYTIMFNKLLCHTNFKTVFVIKMLIRLKKAVHDTTYIDDRDSFINKRVDMDGKLVEYLVKGHFTRNIDSIANGVRQCNPNTHSFKFSESVTNDIIKCFSSGDLAISKSYSKQGVIQMVVNFNNISKISHLRKICTNISTENVKMEVRQLHNTQFGLLDPSETPEGPSSGLVKSMAITTLVTHDNAVDAEIITDNIVNNNKHKNTASSMIKYTLILVNGCIVGFTKSPAIIVDRLRELRDKRMVSASTSISYNTKTNEVLIYTDASRLIRPFLTVNSDNVISYKFNNGMTWNELLDNNVVAFADSTEQKSTVIALYKKDLLTPNIMGNESYLCEMHLSVIFGTSCCIIPFANHEQSPRVSYSANMSKQSIGVPYSNYLNRFDISVMVANSVQKPIVKTFYSDLLGYTELAQGSYPVVAITTGNGYCQEDSILINKASIERGLFNTTVYKLFSTTLESSDEFVSIDPKYHSCSYRNRNYLKLDERGIIKKGSSVKEGDVIIRKLRLKSPGVYEDISVYHKLREVGYVQDIYITNSNIYKVKVRFNRVPLIGDKLASMHAQKGTIGLVVPQEDMPFSNETGISPDIIINPSCMPSRMTVSQLIETVVSKLAFIQGTEFDATPFDEVRNIPVMIKEVGDALVSRGYCSNGEEVLSCGKTGEMYKSSVFMGPVYYKPLKHMIIDKLSARSTGKNTKYTRQPLNVGRGSGAPNSAIKVGNMEGDAIQSHGASSTMYERHVVSADNLSIPTCTKCKSIGYKSCTDCKSVISNKSSTYIFNLFAQTVAVANIKVGIE